MHPFLLPLLLEVFSVKLLELWLQLADLFVGELVDMSQVLLPVSLCVEGLVGSTDGTLEGHLASVGPYVDFKVPLAQGHIVAVGVGA